MRYENPHLADAELLSALDGETSPAAAARVEAHLKACWTCRARSQELDRAITGFVRSYRQEMDPRLSSAAGPRALLKAQMADIEARSDRSWLIAMPWKRDLGLGLLAAVVSVIFFLALAQWTTPSRRDDQARDIPVSAPNARLTPGAAIAVSRAQVCGQVREKNRDVPAALQRAVFEEYGISDANPRAYEVDYLITPALGGSEDLRNLWPHSHAGTVWNSEVKDALEDRLQELVCEGQLDPMVAQQEIARDWIAAYKKYFHTDRPASDRKVEDQGPWDARPVVLAAGKPRV